MRPVAVITGGSRGIGFETAAFLSHRGWDIALCSRDASEAKSAAQHISAASEANVFSAGADVSNATDMKHFASQVIEHFGSLKALICNAAVLGPVGRLADVTSRDMTTAFNVNVMGFVNPCQSFWSYLESTQAFRIIALAGGGLGGPGQMTRAPAYVPSKAALASMTEIISEEVVNAGGTVNVVAPGNIPTGFMKSVLDAGSQAAGEALYGQAIAREGADIGESLGRFLDLLEFLLDESSEFISGRFLSARWNTPESLNKIGPQGLTDSMFRLRRIDDDLYLESQQ